MKLTLTLALALVCAASAAETPKVRWGQDADNLFVEAKVRCAENRVVEITETSLKVSCSGVPSGLLAGGVSHAKKQGSDKVASRQSDKAKEYVLDIVLREPVVVDSSVCKSTANGEECRLTKSHAHKYDRLTRDQNALKGRVSINFAKWIDDDAAEEKESTFDVYEDSGVVSPALDVSALTSLVAKADTVILHAELPWCGACGTTAADMVEAAKALAGEEGVAFAHIDARDHTGTDSPFTAKADCPEQYGTCYVYALKSGEAPAKIKVTTGQLADTVRSFAGPAATELKTEEDLSEFLKANPKAAVGFFKDAQAEEHAFFISMARELSQAPHKVAFGVAFGGALKKHRTRLPFLNAYSSSGTVRSQFKGAFAEPSAHDNTNATHFVLSHTLPLLDSHDWSKRDAMSALDLPIVSVFTVDEDKQIAAGWNDLAKQFRGQLLFLTYDDTSDWMLKDFGVDDAQPAPAADADPDAPQARAPGAAYPVLGVAESFGYDCGKWTFDKHGPGSFDVASSEDDRKEVAAWLERVVSGEQAQAIKSAPAPTEAWESGSVLTVVGSTFRAEVLEREGEVLLNICQSWWDDKTATDDAVAYVARALNGVDGFVAASLDGSANGYPKDEGFPQTGSIEPSNKCGLFLRKPGKKGKPAKVLQYGGKKSAKGVTMWLKKKSKVVKKAWKAVKANIKAANAEAKKAAEEAAAAAEAAAAEEAERLKEKLAAPMTDISGDGGIKKYTFVEGSGPTPPDGVMVSAHYTGTLLDGTKFDSSRDRGDPFSFKLGTGGVIKCWDEAFASMKKGEQALLECTHTFAYGEAGSPPTIPGGATLRFDVELLGWEGDDADAGADAGDDASKEEL